MPPPSPLAIATSSVTRLLKEESSYRTELESQQKRLHSVEAQTDEDEDGNRGFQIAQEVNFQSSPVIHFLRFFLYTNKITRLGYSEKSDPRDGSGFWALEGIDQDGG